MRLISDLSPQDEAAVRKALEELLLSVMQQPADGIRLDIASDEKESVGLRELFRRRFKSWKFRRWLGQFVKDEAPESPLRDYVFLSFMSGRRPRKLTVSLPDSIRKFVFPEGQRALGLRPASLLAVAIAMSLTVFAVNKFTGEAGPPIEKQFFYSQMSEEEQQQFVKDRAQEISARLGSGTTTISQESLNRIKQFVDGYDQRIDSNIAPDVPEVFGRVIPYAGTISGAFQENNMPPVLGLYLALVETEYGNPEQVSFGQTKNVSADLTSVATAAREAAQYEAGCAKGLLGFDSGRMPYVILCHFAASSRIGFDATGDDPTAWERFDRLETSENSVLITDPSTSSNLRNAVQNVFRFYAAAIVGENPQRFRMKMEPLSSYGSTTATPNTSEQIFDLIAEFKGDNRRQASDQLVAMYPQNKTAVVEGLINAILDSGPDTYRVNLYIARTLGKISPNWEGTYDQFQRLEALTDTPNYQEDETFRGWVNQALARRITNAPTVAPSPSPSRSSSPPPRRPRPRRPSPKSPGKSTASLVSQRNQRIDFGGASGGDVARE